MTVACNILNDVNHPNNLGILKSLNKQLKKTLENNGPLGKYNIKLDELLKSKKYLNPKEYNK